MSINSEDPNYPDKIEHVYTLNVPAGQAPERIDAFITRSIEHATRTRVQKAIDRGAVTVNGKPKKSNYKIRPYDTIIVTVLKPPPLQLIPQDLPLVVLYEDDDVLVLDKPAGMAVHPGIGNRIGTLVNAVLWHLGVRDPLTVEKPQVEWDDSEGEESDDTDADTDVDGEDEDGDEPIEDELSTTGDEALSSDAIRPGIVHRLDKDTSGVMVVGKTYEATQALSNQFAERTVGRQYVALAWGVVRDDVRVIEGEIGRSSRDRKLMQVVERGGKFSATEVTVVERYDCASLVTCRLHTGRTHQIRVHLTSIHHPLVGDEAYGGRETAFNGVHHLFRQKARAALNAIGRQALHARSLEFDHPKTGKRLSFTSPVPEDFLQAILAVRPTEVGPLPPCVQE